MKLKFKKPESQLDEMQEQTLRKYGNIGYYIAFYGLILVFFVQLFLGAGFKEVIGEFCVLTVMSVYGFITSTRKGLWSRYFKPGIKCYLAMSAVSGILIGIFVFIFGLVYGPIWAPLLDTVVWSGITFLVTLLFSFLLGSLTKRRAQKLEEEDEEE